MNKIKNWFIAAGITASGLVGYHASIDNSSVVEVRPSVVQPVTNATIITPTISDIQRIIVRCDETCTTEEALALGSLVKKLNDIESSDCFSKYLLDPSNGLDVSQTNFLSRTDAVQLIQMALVMTKISYYSKPRNWFTKVIVVGYENGDGIIHANRLAWQNMGVCEKAANIGHEISHGPPMSFVHDFYATQRRPYSVPYEIEAAVMACCTN